MILRFLDLKFAERWKGYSNLVLRAGIASVLLYFGINEIATPGFGLAYMSPWSLSIVSALIAPELFIQLFGAGHIIGAVALLVGFKTRFFALVTALILAAIVANLGYNELSARDLAIMSGALLLFLQGGGKYSLDEKLA